MHCCQPQVFNLPPFTVSRGPDSEGERGEHHREDLLASHSLDPEQVNTLVFPGVGERKSLLSLTPHRPNRANNPP